MNFNLKKDEANLVLIFYLLYILTKAFYNVSFILPLNVKIHEL